MGLRNFFLMVMVFGIVECMASKQYDDLVKIVKSGAEEPVVIAFIEASDSTYNLTSDQVLQLHEIGASSKVIIAAMKHKVVAPAMAKPQPVQNETTFVAEPPHYAVYRVAPPYYRPWWRTRAYLEAPNIAKMNQAIAVDVAAMMFGEISMNYELLLGHQHGIVVEGSYFGGLNTHGENAELAYRWHWSKSMNSGFVGAFVNGGRNYGYDRDFHDDNGVAFSNTSVTVGLAIGKRWVSAYGLNIVARIGYGYTWIKFDDPAPDQHTINKIRAETGLDSELSIGWAF